MKEKECLDRIIDLNAIPEEMLSMEIYAKVLENVNWNIDGGKHNYSSFKNLIIGTYDLLTKENSSLLNEFTENVRHSLKLVDRGIKAIGDYNMHEHETYAYVHFDGYSFKVKDEVALLQLIKWCENFKQKYKQEHPKKTLPKINYDGSNLDIMDTILNNLVIPKEQYSFIVEFPQLNKNCNTIYNYLVNSKNDKKLDSFCKLINSVHFNITEVKSENEFGEEEIIGYALDCKSRAVRQFIRNFIEKINSRVLTPSINIGNKETMKLIDTLIEDELTN